MACNDDDKVELREGFTKKNQVKSVVICQTPTAERAKKIKIKIPKLPN